MESNAVILHKFWRPQPTLPCFGLQYSISKKTRTTVSLSSMQGVFAESSLRKQAWRNPKEGRVGCLHQNIFTRKLKWPISHLPPTFAIIIHIPRPLRPCIWRPRVPVPHVPASHTWCPQVPRLASPSPRVPTHASRCPRPTFIHSHFVWWKFPSSPGSYPTENRSCRKDLWAAFVVWDVFYFAFVCFYFPCGGKKTQTRSTKCTFKVTFFIFLNKLNVWKRCSVLE